MPRVFPKQRLVGSPGTQHSRVFCFFSRADNFQSPLPVAGLMEKYVLRPGGLLEL